MAPPSTLVFVYPGEKNNHPPLIKDRLLSPPSSSLDDKSNASFIFPDRHN